MLDLVQLRSFVTVQQMGSFTFAAERLGLGQSTVSQHISKLEAVIGRQLLARDTHKVVLTPDGEALLGHARTMLSIEGQVQALFTAQRLRGTLQARRIRGPGCQPSAAGAGGFRPVSPVR